MHNNDSGKRKSHNVFLIVGILFIAINLRPALASVGPLIEDIRQTTGLSNTMLGLLTTLPLIGFGVVSTTTPLFTRRFGMGGTLLGALLLLSTGIVIRSLDSVIFLYLGTLLLGTAIAFGNVLLPSLTKRNFERKSGYVTSLYSGVMAIGASVAAGFAVPIAQNHGLGWRGSLAIWAILALIASLIWMPQVKRLKKSPERRSFVLAMKSLISSRIAWGIALFMGLQSLTFYVILAWLPAILLQREYSPGFSGWMLSLSQATGIIGSMIIPIISGRKKDQRKTVAFLVFVEVVALIGLLFPELGMVPIWVSLIGFVLGGTFGLSLLFLVLRARDAESATELSGMAQSVGYIVAASGPFIFGSIFDLTGNWHYSLIFLLIIATAKLLTGLTAGRPGVI